MEAEEAQRLADEAERQVLMEMKDAGYIDPKLESMQYEDPEELEDVVEEDQHEHDGGEGEGQNDQVQGELEEEEEPAVDPEVEPPQQEDSYSWRSWRGGGRGGWKGNRGKGYGVWKGNRGYGEWEEKKGWNDWNNKKAWGKWKDNKWHGHGDWNKNTGKGKGKGGGGKKGHAVKDEDDGDQHGFRPMDRSQASSRGGHYVEGGFVDAEGVFRPYFGCKMCCTGRIHELFFYRYFSTHLSMSTLRMQSLHVCLA